MRIEADISRIKLPALKEGTDLDDGNGIGTPERCQSTDWPY